MTANTKKNVEMFAQVRLRRLRRRHLRLGQGVLPKDVPAMQAQTAMYNKDRDAAEDAHPGRIRCARQAPLVDAAKIAQAGYCFGGSTAVEFGATGVPLAAAIAIHGSFANHQAGWAKSLKGKMLVLHGAEDAGYPLNTPLPA